MSCFALDRATVNERVISVRAARRLRMKKFDASVNPRALAIAS